MAGEKPKTEQEWLSCSDAMPILTLLGYLLYRDVYPGFHTDQTPLVEFLQRRGASGRRMRLFACACCRAIWQLLPADQSRHSVQMAERFADRDATEDELKTAHEEAECVAKALQGHSAGDAAFAAAEASVQRHPFSPCISIGEWYCTNPFWTVVAYHTAGRGNGFEEASDASTAQSKVLRDILGNPFRPVALDHSWLTQTVTNLATAAYEERSLPSGELDSARLAILADALEEVRRVTM